MNHTTTRGIPCDFIRFGTKPFQARSKKNEGVGLDEPPRLSNRSDPELLPMGSWLLTQEKTPAAMFRGGGAEEGGRK
jgi:hypothetical protein